MRSSMYYEMPRRGKWEISGLGGKSKKNLSWVVVLDYRRRKVCFGVFWAFFGWVLVVLVEPYIGCNSLLRGLQMLRQTTVVTV